MEEVDLSVDQSVGAATAARISSFDDGDNQRRRLQDRECVSHYKTLNLLYGTLGKCMTLLFLVKGSGLLNEWHLLDRHIHT